MLINELKKEDRIDKGYYITFNEYVEHCGYKYVYGAIYNKWKNYKNYFIKKGLTYDDYCDEIICGIIKDWDKIDYQRGSVKTYIGMKVNAYHLHLIKYYDAEKRNVNEESIMYLDKNTETNSETNEADGHSLIRSSDDIELENNESEIIKNIINLLINDNQKRSFELYLKGYNYTQIELILKKQGIQRCYHSIRKDVSDAKKFLKTRYTPFTLLERI